jgi:hypothetical protein
MGWKVDRRRLLAGVTALLAGCVGDDAGPDRTDPASTSTDSPNQGGTDGHSGGRTTATADTEADSTSDTTTTAVSATDGGTELDLLEANVTGVAVEAGSDGYRFDVTLFHDDDGEAGYADWWQVETRTGDRLGRRELLHPHGTREFTRSETIAIPEGTDCVVVRGHDQTHGYGGLAVLVTPATGATRTVRQGSEPVSMADEPCP